MGVNIFFTFGIFLILLLAVLLILFFRIKKKDFLNKLIEIKKEEAIELSELSLQLKDKFLSSKELKQVIELILKDYSKINEFSLYEAIILHITLHPNTNKNIIIYFDKELSKSNPLYKKQISQALNNALNSRNFK